MAPIYTSKGFAVGGATRRCSIDPVRSASDYIAGLAGKTFWLKANAGVVYDGSNRISSWTDQSSYGAVFQPITGVGTDHALRVASAYNGLDTVRFDGTTSRMLSTANLDPFQGSTSMTTYIVLKQGSTGAGNGCFFNDYDGVGTTRLSFQRNGAGNVYLHTNDTVNAADANAVVTENTLTQVAVVRNGTTTHKAYTKGVLQATDSTPGNIAMLAKKMGLGCQGSLGSLLWTGDLCELLIFNSAHDAATQAAVESALASKWAIA
ncbi:MAG: LamG domain-containing protein [bacterium]|nr:LamG domain-containing protein [bacterium]